MRKAKEYEIKSHGYEAADYFQGCGTAFTRFEECYTGIGDNASAAYDDALEIVAASGEYDYKSLPSRPRGIRKTDKVPARLTKEPENEIHWYVSILVR